MTFVRYTTGGQGAGAESAARAGSARVEERRATRSSRLAAGTLACRRCDAPVAIGTALPLGAQLRCPFCHHQGPVRDFLSLASPTRPARVVVRVRQSSVAG